MTTLSRRKLLIGACCTLPLIAILYLLLRHPSPDTLLPGEVVLRAGLPDSTLITSIYEFAPGLAGDLLVGILAYEREVKIDRVDHCSTILDAYADSPQLIPVPMFSDPGAGCFSYLIRYDLALDGELIPITLAMIHPPADRDLLE